ncbi:abortive infection system antitoxin AbiGi family protein [Fibrisoma montanum]|uniref:abortive infection system antitoxin AbiGi family protein n=1 Tax=Fibrisoma montanum TaxID=2305895 RepID=UPI001314B645|nr:abortive infection system antitoxin AbiGi family protein [Fibrisoma montanum]
MTISAKALFHFTGRGEKEVLKKILSNGFRPSYCKEFGECTGGRITESQIPMVCFCDIPLSSIRSHMLGHSWEHNGEKVEAEGYGSYGLGMTKEWGKANGLNPVLYFHYDDNSTYIKSMVDAQSILYDFFRLYDPLVKQSFSKYPLISQLPNHTREILNMYFAMKRVMERVQNCFSYNKPYEDKRDGRLYYNEREWRFTIPYDQATNYEIPVIFPSLYPELLEKKHELMKLIEEKYMLKFTPHDIKYIIVKDENDIEDIIEYMRSTGKYSEDQIKMLYPRIITNRQILEDF